MLYWKCEINIKSELAAKNMLPSERYIMYILNRFRFCGIELQYITINWKYAYILHSSESKGREACFSLKPSQRSWIERRNDSSSNILLSVLCTESLHILFKIYILRLSWHCEHFIYRYRFLFPSMHVNMIYDDISYDFHAIDRYFPSLAYICTNTNVFISIWIETFHFFPFESYLWVWSLICQRNFQGRKIFSYRNLL